MPMFSQPSRAEFRPSLRRLPWGRNSRRGAVLAMMVLAQLSCDRPAGKAEGAKVAESKAAKADPMEEIRKLRSELSRTPEVPRVSVRAAAPLKPGGVLLQVRDATGKLGEDSLRQFEQAVAAGMAATGFELVALRDLVGVPDDLKGSLGHSLQDTPVASVALAQGLGFVLFADIQQFLEQPTEIGGRRIVNFDLRGGLSLLSATKGVRLHTVADQVRSRGFETANLAAQGLQDLAGRLALKAGGWKLPESKEKPVEIEVHVKLADLRLPYLPSPDGRITMEDLPIYADGASVELDGIMLGNAPCRVEVWPGPHRLRIVREGVNESEMTLQVTAAGRYDLTLTPGEAARNALNEQLVFLENLRQQQREGRQQEAIMAAQAECLRGLAIMFRQSGYRVDARKIDDPDELSTRGAAPEPQRP